MMYIETHTFISFVLPDEFLEAEHFRENNDMSEWKQSVTTAAATFTRKLFYKAERKTVVHQLGKENRECQ